VLPGTRLYPGRWMQRHVKNKEKDLDLPGDDAIISHAKTGEIPARVTQRPDRSATPAGFVGRKAGTSWEQHAPPPDFPVK